MYSSLLVAIDIEYSLSFNTSEISFYWLYCAYMFSRGSDTSFKETLVGWKLHSI